MVPSVDQIADALATSPVIGLAIVSLGMLMVLWRYHTDQLTKHVIQIEKKDAVIKEMSDKVLTAFTDNTKSNVELRQAVANNTEALKPIIELSEKIYDTLLKK